MGIRCWQSVTRQDASRELFHRLKKAIGIRRCRLDLHSVLQSVYPFKYYLVTGLQAFLDHEELAIARAFKYIDLCCLQITCRFNEVHESFALQLIC